MKAGIALDDWKLPTFRNALTKAGFKYEDGGSPVYGMTILMVVFKPNEMDKLTKVVTASQAECARNGKP